MWDQTQFQVDICCAFLKSKDSGKTPSQVKTIFSKIVWWKVISCKKCLRKRGLTLRTLQPSAPAPIVSIKVNLRRRKQWRISRKYELKLTYAKLTWNASPSDDITILSAQFRSDPIWLSLPANNTIPSHVIRDTARRHVQLALEEKTTWWYQISNYPLHQYIAQIETKPHTKFLKFSLGIQ